MDEPRWTVTHRRRLQAELQLRGNGEGTRGRGREEEDDPVGKEAHQPATQAQAARVGTLSWVGPNPFSARRTIRTDGEDLPETFGVLPHSCATWTAG